MIVLSLNSLVRELVYKWKKGTVLKTTSFTRSCQVSRKRQLAAKGLTPEIKQEKMKKVLDNGFLLWDNK